MCIRDRDVAIDRDLDQIKKMTTALRERISDDRIDSIYSMSGEEKEREFEALAKDLHDVCLLYTSCYIAHYYTMKYQK